MRRLFLDTSYVIALTTPADAYHSRANVLAHALLSEQARLITTRAVLLEVGDALGHFAARSQAIRLLGELEHDPSLQIVPISDDVYHRAVDLYTARLDKEWGLTDCVSFVVMQDYSLTEALTADRHFRQAGFVALMRDD
ncbi:MAG TPA: PIN domain-containing protein [Gemmatimonadaceae bacterium]|jgi:predicted nucleic acid-binding protein|nr:PIN domain-containing protein [Gemmatimonadaceae bacterium]